jgi:hypothetical protein
MRTYLMEIPQEWYDEDQAVKRAKLDETERAIYGDRGDPRKAQAEGRATYGHVSGKIRRGP